VASEDKCPTCGSVTIDDRDASARLSSYLRRETGASGEEADRRAGDMMTLIGGGIGAMALRPIGAMASNWWLVALEGVLAIIFGILTLVEPAAALAAVVLIFGVWAFIDGISALTLALTGWKSWQMVVLGLVGIAAGVFTFYRPNITAFALYATIAAWAIARGIIEIVVAIELRKRIKGEMWLVLAGIASVLFGVLMIVLPVAGAFALAWLLGVYALTFGVIMLALSFKLRGLRHGVERVEKRIGAPTIQPA
jgi:uncharacterized membrane protein HdeD (DUF308 family)